MQENEKYVVWWQSQVTGAKGHGSKLMSKAEAEENARALNAIEKSRRDPIMRHWAAPLNEQPTA